MQDDDQGDKLNQANLKSISGVLFFGVPNQGMGIESLIPMVGDLPNRYFLESLSKESASLRDQARQFQKAFPFRDFQVISFYETKRSPTAKVSQAKTSLLRGGLRQVIECERQMGDERTSRCLSRRAFRNQCSGVGIYHQISSPHR